MVWDVGRWFQLGFGRGGRITQRGDDSGENFTEKLGRSYFSPFPFSLYVLTYFPLTFPLFPLAFPLFLFIFIYQYVHVHIYLFFFTLSPIFLSQIITVDAIFLLFLSEFPFSSLLRFTLSLCVLLVCVFSESDKLLC